MVRIVLASASPRRAELLRQIGLAFETLESSVPEEPGDETDPAMLAEKLALLKAQAAAGKCSAEVIIAADTIVSADGKLLDKPRDVREAAAMLRSLSGRRHEVLTGVAVIDRRGGRLLTHVEKTAVYMRVIPDDELDWYVQSGEPFDKAGGYGIQGRAAVFVERVEGCYFNVVGLPLSALWRMLHRLGVEPWEGAGFVDFTAPGHQGPASA